MCKKFGKISVKATPCETGGFDLEFFNSGLVEFPWLVDWVSGYGDLGRAFDRARTNWEMPSRGLFRGLKHVKFGRAEVLLSDHFESSGLFVRVFFNGMHIDRICYSQREVFWFIGAIKNKLRGV